MEFYRLTIAALLLCLLQSLKGIVSSASCPSHIAKMKKTYTATHKETCYLFVDKEVYWKTARDSCWELGGDMLVIKDKETMDFIRKKLNSRDLWWRRRKGVWLGARFVSRQWKWTDGSKMTYENWASGQPSKIMSYFSVEDCAQMRRSDNWKWHDYICGSLKFHYNYICQFPAVNIDAISTLTPTSKKIEIKAYTKMLDTSTRNRQFRDLNSKSNDEDSSDVYQQLGQNIYRLMKEKGMSSKSLAKLLHDSAMSDSSSDLDFPEQATSRISNFASNQEEDNGNMKIVIIIVSLTCGFLLILFVLFFLIWRHNKNVKAKAAERAVRYSAHPPPTDNASRAVPSRVGAEDYPPPPIPATRPPPLDGSYLTPKEINGMYTEVLRPNGTASEPNGHCLSNNYLLDNIGSAPPSSMPCNGSDSELGACGRIYPETEESSPLMSGHAMNSASSLNNCIHHNGTVTVTNGPTESCTCAAVGSGSEQGEYMAMNSLVSKDSSIGSCEKLLTPEDKHTYSNVHMDTREATAVENHYETLP